MSHGLVYLPGGPLDPHAPFIFEAKSIAADDLSNLVCRHFILSRSLENPGKRSCGDGYKGARATFAKERIFGGRRFFEFDIRAKLGPSMLRPYKVGEARFRQRNGDASAANDVRRTYRAIGCK